MGATGQKAVSLCRRYHWQSEGRRRRRSCSGRRGQLLGTGTDVITQRRHRHRAPSTNQGTRQTLCFCVESKHICTTPTWKIIIILNKITICKNLQQSCKCFFLKYKMYSFYFFVLFLYISCFLFFYFTYDYILLTNGTVLWPTHCF